MSIHRIERIRAELQRRQALQAELSSRQSEIAPPTSEEVSDQAMTNLQSEVANGQKQLNGVNEQPPQEDSFLDTGFKAIAEIAAGANKSVTDLIDFLGPDQVNNILQLSGSDSRVPTLGEQPIVQQATTGGFIEGKAGQALRMAGQAIPAAVGGGQIIRQAAQAIPKLTPSAATTGQALTQNLAKGTTPAIDLVVGAGSGAGAELGKEGGTTGEIIGGIVGGGVAATVKGVAESGFRAIRNAARSSLTQRSKSEAVDVTKETIDIIENNKPKSPLAEEIGDVKIGVEPELQEYKAIEKALNNKKVNVLAEQVDIDKPTFDALQELGIVTNPDAYSSSRSFIDMQQALKSRPGSMAATIEEKSLIDLGKKADELVVELNGSVDKSMLDLKIKNQVLGRINNLEKRAEKLYKGVILDPKNPELGGVPRQTKLTGDNARAYIKQQLDLVDGDASQLSPAERRIKSLFEKDEGMHAPPSKRDPTYEMVDRLRKDIGNALGKKTDVFKSDDAATLKQIYKVLIEDQQGVADAFGVGRRFALARRVVSTRKDLEDTAKNLVGKDLMGSIVPKMRLAGTGITKGVTAEFNRLMQSLPRNKRPEVAATMLNDIFTSGARQGRDIGGGFVPAWESLNRNKAAKKILFAELPKGAEKRFDRLGIAARGIFRALKLENKSKTARDVIRSMEDGGFMSKILDAGEKIPRLATAGIPVGKIARNVLKPEGTAVAAENLLSSPAFLKAVVENARGRGVQAEKAITNSKIFKQWITTVTPENKKQILAVGFIPWLLEKDEK